MNNKYIVYLHKNIINNKVYVGITKEKNPERRWRKDGKGYSTQTYFYSAIKKYGWNNFEHFILEKNIPEYEIDEKEKYWINIFQSTNENYGYNISSGGRTGEKIKNKKQIKIYCKETGEGFYSLSDAAEWAGLSRTSMTNLTMQAKGKRYFAGHHPDTGEKLHWCFTKDEINLKNREKQAHNIKSVIDLTNKKKYSSILKASQETGISQNTILKACKSKGEEPIIKANSYWCYESDYEEIKNKEYKIINSNTGSPKKIYNINTGLIFNSMTEAAKWCGLSNAGRIGMCCNGLAKTAGKHPQTGEKLMWKLFDE